jgi:hypothetical protein
VTQGCYADFLMFLVILLIKMGVQWKNSDKLDTRNILSGCQMLNPGILNKHQCFGVNPFHAAFEMCQKRWIYLVFLRNSRDPLVLTIKEIYN